MIRVEVSDAVWRWREVIAAGVLGAFGVWLIWLGGYVLGPLGALLVVLAAFWGVTAWRRVRFSQEVLAPGVVEVDEGQVGYLGPSFGGYVALPDLVEVRLVAMYGRRLWRLKQADGQALLIPVDAAGAERLFDAFGSLPGMDMAAALAALEVPVVRGGGVVVGEAAVAVVWRRQGVIGR